MAVEFGRPSKATNLANMKFALKLHARSFLSLQASNLLAPDALLRTLCATLIDDATEVRHLLLQLSCPCRQ
eukprot:313464-Pelagomonas_calceolata.AAC.1